MPGSGGSDGSAVRVVHRLVTAAELRALHTTSVELVPAPAATQLLWPLTWITTFRPGNVAFDGLVNTILAYGPVPPGELQITVGLSTGAVTNVARLNTKDLSSDLFNNVVPLDQATLLGEPLLLIDGSAGGSTVGNGTLAVDLSYLVLTP